MGAVRIVRTAGSLLLVLAIGMAGFLAGRLVRAPVPRAGVGATTHHTGLIVEQVRQLATLITTRVEVADVQMTSVEGYTGGLRVAIVVRGDFLLGVDLDQARFESVDADARTAVLVLPAPAAASPRVDHARTRVFELSNRGLWVIVPGDAGRSKVIDRAYAEAQRYVAAAAGDPTLVERSRRQTERVLEAFFHALGWTVRVRWAG